jgi:hypothetical protein
VAAVLSQGLRFTNELMVEMLGWAMANSQAMGSFFRIQRQPAKFSWKVATTQLGSAMHNERQSDSLMEDW